MSNFTMHIELFGNGVRCETEGSLVSLNDLFNAGNAWRLNNGRASMQMQAFLKSASLQEYVEAAALEWQLPPEAFISIRGKGKYTRTMAHVSVAILAAENISPQFHAKVHKTFIEGKLLEFRELGGTEFRSLNAAIDLHLPDRIGKNNTGCYINAAKMLNKLITNEDGQSLIDWSKATVAQTHKRYECEKRLVGMLELGVIRDWEHLKSIIPKL